MFFYEVNLSVFDPGSWALQEQWGLVYVLYSLKYAFIAAISHVPVVHLVTRELPVALVLCC